MLFLNNNFLVVEGSRGKYISCPRWLLLLDLGFKGTFVRAPFLDRNQTKAIRTAQFLWKNSIWSEKFSSSSCPLLLFLVLNSRTRDLRVACTWILCVFLISYNLVMFFLNHIVCYHSINECLIEWRCCLQVWVCSTLKTCIRWWFGILNVLWWE